jgi:hypothetical protein
VANANEIILAKGRKPDAGSRLQVGIYQLADDSLFMQNRIDGTGWDWGWADWRRDWMDDTPNKYAYRCLPLTIANQTGWWIRNPVGFTATWRGRLEPHAMEFIFDTNPQTWSPGSTTSSARGVITWNTPFLFRTKPEGSRLLILGPANSSSTHPAADGAHRERLDQHVVHDELEVHRGATSPCVSRLASRCSGDPDRHQHLRRPGAGRRDVHEARRRSRDRQELPRVERRPETVPRKKARVAK